MMDQQRQELLHLLYKRTNKKARNIAGQFATPVAIADEMVGYGLSQLTKETISFLEPGFGSGTFFASLLKIGADITKAAGFETDPAYILPLNELYKNTKLELFNADFTKAAPTPFDLILCNPPYVRHHHLDGDQKIALAEKVNSAYGIRLSGLAGLYTYFMVLAEQWLAEDGIAGFIVPAEFLDVNYGSDVKRFLLQNVRLQHIHLFDQAASQFDDALVSSAIVWYSKGKTRPDDLVKFSYGTHLSAPEITRQVPLEQLHPKAKWSNIWKEPIFRKTGLAVKVLKDFFDIKRGLATGDNSFFILPEAEVLRLGIEAAVLTPILPSPRHLENDIIKADAQGLPLLDRKLFLLDCRLNEQEIALLYPATASYLTSGAPTVSKTYLSRSRKKWYFQELRQPAPIVCTYIGRTSAGKGGRPIRFIRNESIAIANNSYLMLYPKGFWAETARLNTDLMDQVWRALQTISDEAISAGGRGYGGGMQKIEPGELANLPAPMLDKLLGGKNVMHLFGAIV